MQELKTALNGWKNYFGIAEVLSPLREIDKWVRRRLRCYAWKQWGSAGYRDTSENAGSACAGPGIPARAHMGQGSMRTTVMQGTAGYVTRMSGGVGGRGREASSYPDWRLKFMITSPIYQNAKRPVA